LKSVDDGRLGGVVFWNEQADFAFRFRSKRDW